MKGVAKKELFKAEDWLAVWFGFLIIVLVLIGIRPQMPIYRWSTTGEFNTTLTESGAAIEGLIMDAKGKGESDVVTAAMALKAAVKNGDRLQV